VAEQPAALRERVRAFLRWVKIVALIVLITVFVVVVLQNVVERATIIFILQSWRWTTNSAMVVSVSFLLGVFVTLLVVFLRRSFGK